jgi:hypothetical protein
MGNVGGLRENSDPRRSPAISIQSGRDDGAKNSAEIQRLQRSVAAIGKEAEPAFDEIHGVSLANRADFRRHDNRDGRQSSR